MGTRLLRHDPTCAAHARRCVADDLRASHVAPDSVDDVLLVLSELVTNAVLHTSVPAVPAGELSVGWDVGEDEVTVCVDDADPTPPAPRVAADRDLTGRGLALVAAIASDWGFSPGVPGKRVWARIPVHRG